MRLGNVDANINDLWTVCWDSGELTSAVSSYQISGLDGNTDIEYKFIIRLISSNDVCVPSIIFNGDALLNYGYQYMKGANAIASASRLANTNSIPLWLGENVANGNSQLSMGHIFAKSGKVRTVNHMFAHNINGTTVSQICKVGSVWNNTADNITSFRLSGALGIGTRIILLKKVHATDGLKTGIITPNKIVGAWERIVNYTVVGAAISSYQVTGIAGNTNPIYRVIIRGVDDDTVGNWYLRLNNDSTANKYGYQYLRGDNAVVSALRGTLNGLYIGATAVDSELTMGDILLYLKSGFVRTCLNTFSSSIATTTITNINILGQSFNDTVNEITTLDFVPAADKFNIGTRIIVERLNL